MQSLRRIPVEILLLSTFAAAVLTTAALSPAAGTGAEGATNFSGTSAGALVYSNNAGAGTALEGVTGAIAGGKGVWGIGNNSLSSSIGVRGTVYGPSSTGMIAEALNTDLAHPSIGIVGSSVSGNAIVGQSTRSNGVVGRTSFPAPSATAAAAGVLGQDLSTANPSFNSGVAGISNHGTGVFGKSSEPGLTAAVYGLSSSSLAYSGGTGVFGQTSGSNGVGVRGDSPAGYGVIGNSHASVGTGGVSINYAGVRGDSTYYAGVMGVSQNKMGVLAMNYAPPSPAPGWPALWIISFGGAPLIRATDAFTDPKIPSDVMSLDINGNMSLKGSLTTMGSPLTVHRIASGVGGAYIGTYSAQQTAATVEDIGEAQLVNGIARVRLDPAFTAVIDPRSIYLVFITPQGDTSGLYVAQRSLTGFVVREHGFNHSTVAFDYRIVAKPKDSTDQRLPLIKPSLRAPNLSQPLNDLRLRIKAPLPTAPRIGAGYIPKLPPDARSIIGLQR